MLPSLLKRNVFVGHPALPFIRVTVLLVAQFLQHREPSSGDSPPTRSGHGSATTYPPPIGWTRVDEREAGEQSPMTFTADRKSTRLNSSHLVISYAVFCLK